MTGALVAALCVAACSSSGEGSGPEPPPTAGEVTPAPEAVPTASATATETARRAPAALDGELANGLDYLIEGVAGAASAAVVVVFEIGEDHDPGGRAGLGHLSEHLWITAATALEPARDAGALAAEYPLGWNAQTGEDFTVFATVVPNSAVETELALVAARMSSLRLTPADLERERPRILAEVDNMFGGIPELGARNLARERLRPGRDGGRRGGSRAVLETVELPELAAHIQLYGPQIATISVTGGVDTAQVEAAVIEHFSPLAAGPAAPSPPARPEPEPGLDVTAGAAPPGFAAIAHPAPEPNSPQYPAFLVAMHRLFTRSPQAGLSPVYAPIDDPRVVTVAAEVAPGESAEAAVERVRQLVGEIVDQPLAAAEAQQVLAFFDPLLGFTANEQFAAQNPYGAAFGAARRLQLGIDSVALADALDELDAQSYREFASGFVGQPLHAGAVVPAR